MHEYVTIRTKMKQDAAAAAAKMPFDDSDVYIWRKKAKDL